MIINKHKPTIVVFKCDLVSLMIFYFAVPTQEQRLNYHHRLGQVSQKCQRELDIEGITQPDKRARLAPLTCPVCITAKTRRHPRPTSSNIQDRSAYPWEDVFIDLSGKFSTKSITGAKYSVVFVDSHSGP